MYTVIVKATPFNDLEQQVSIAVETTVTDDPLAPRDPTGPIEPRAPDLSIHEVVFSEFMFESEGGENSLPQWIEVYNNTDEDINLRGWQLQWKRLQPSFLEVTTAFKEDFIISSQHSKLLVTALGRHSMGGDLSDAAVYQLHVLHAEELRQNDIANRNQLLTRGGFSLKLIDPEDASLTTSAHLQMRQMMSKRGDSRSV